MRHWQGLVGGLFLLIAALFFGASLLIPRIQAEQWNGTVSAAGQIIGFTDQGETRRPLVSFIASDGDPYAFEAKVYSSSMQAGQIVPVHYTLQPQFRAYLEVDMTIMLVVFGAVGCFFMVPGLLFVFLQVRKSVLKHQLLLYGSRLEAVVTAITEKPGVRVNGRLAYVITCSMHNPQGMDVWKLRSGCIFQIPPTISVGSKIPVLIDLAQPQHYLMLLDVSEDLCPQSPFQPSC